MTRQSRRHDLDYGEAESFQNLALCRFLRSIGDKLQTGLAGSSRISVQDLQTHSHVPSAPALLEHAGVIQSRVASETTYCGWTDARTSRTRCASDLASEERSMAETRYVRPSSGL
jgi:hypothetical protein